MLDFEVQRCSRKCCKTDREFKPGEEYYSALVAEGARVERFDYCAEAWEGPPLETVGWWKSRVPTPTCQRLQLAPNDVILHYFEQLEGQADKQDVRYVLALLMLRRRIVRLEEMEDNAAGQQVMVMFCPRNETEYRAGVHTPDDARAREIQEELARLLFADAR